MSYTIGDMIKKHQELKAALDAQREKWKAVQAAMEALENAIQASLIDSGQQNAKTRYGTAYLVHNLSVKVDNRDTYLGFVQQGNWNFLDARVLKEPVREWIEANPLLAPSSIGLVIAETISCNIRK